jgi:uncharacterized protein (TIGR02145 family)
MKVIYINVLLIFLSINGFAQTSKVAILDFENTSGKTEYDALGKAMSSMLITDLSNNIHPKKVEFFERSQLNKLLDEQKLQKSKNFDAKTAVDFGKLSGVNYVFVGSVFVMDGNCNITSKLVDVQTSKIILSKEANGKIETWLQLKSQLAEEIAQQLNNPVTLDPSYKDQTTTLATLNQYGKVLSTMDQGDADKAEQMRSLFEETNPDFKYFTDLKDDIDQLKKRISELETVTEVLTDAFELGDKAEMKQDYPNTIKFFEKFLANPGNLGYIENKKLYAYSKIALSQFKTGDYQNALLNSKNAQKIYTYFPEANEIELLALIKLNENQKAEDKYNFIIDSLIFTNELNFRRKEYNPSLIWESINGVNFFLRPQENSEAWIYLGISNSGYGSSVENAVQIKKILNQNSLTLPQSKNQLSQYEKIEAKLLAFNDSLIFSSDQIVNFYKLSLQYADELNAIGNKAKYKLHLKKEITRMENFGITCSSCNGVRISWGESNGILWDLGLSNSRLEFDDNFHLIYGEFIYKYLILLLKENQIEDAATIYKKISTTRVKDRNSYFYGHYWELILGLRTINEDFNFRFTEQDFEKKIDERITKDLKKEKLSIDILNKVKSFKIKVNSGSIIVETDDKIDSKKSIWSKNLGIIEDGLGNKIKLATEETFWGYYEDSIPAYCFYDFEESNGEKYGKLYNYWALRLISENPPIDWRIANQKDYATLLGLDEIMTNENKTNYDELLDRLRFPQVFNHFTASGQRHNSGFCCVDEQAWFWTSEISDNPIYHKVVDIYSDGEVRFSDFNCKECYFSIRLVKK